MNQSVFLEQIKCGVSFLFVNLASKVFPPSPGIIRTGDKHLLNPNMKRITNIAFYLILLKIYNVILILFLRLKWEKFLLDILFENKI